MASEAPRPVKGILKKPATPSASASAGTRAGTGGSAAPRPHHRPPSPSDEDAAAARAREIALQHARIIQDQKDAEAQITDNIVALTDYPLVRSPSRSAARPDPSDAAGFKRLIRTFQPSDYDDLVEERNTCGLCGYALCPRPHQSFGGRGTWKLVNPGRSDFSIVERRELERWCSQECARRAMYVKVQLNETAAWERAGIPDIRIDLLEEHDDDEGRPRRSGSETEHERLAVEMGRLQLQEERKAAQESSALALERGDAGQGSASKPINVVIREKTVTGQPEAPFLEEDAPDKAKAVEGHQTKFKGHQAKFEPNP